MLGEGESLLASQAAFDRRVRLFADRGGVREIGELVLTVYDRHAPAMAVTRKLPVQVLKADDFSIVPNFMRGLFWDRPASEDALLHVLYDQAASLVLRGVRTITASPRFIVRRAIWQAQMAPLKS
jgi:hypothetical protein